MRTFEEVQDELRECINHAYRDECEDIQKYSSNVTHLDNAMQRLNELIEIHKAESDVLDKLSTEIESMIAGCKRGKEIMGDDFGVFAISIQAYSNVLEIIEEYKGEVKC